MGNNPNKAANRPGVDVGVGTYCGRDNPADVLEGEEATPEGVEVKMADSEIDRQDSRAPLKDNAAADDDAIVDVIPSGPDSYEDGEANERPCGLGPCRPRYLQFIAGGPKAFAFWSMLYLLIKTAGTVYIGSAIGNIEKQFKLSSLESGAIIILNDAMDMVLVIFVAYFGHKSHRPRIMAIGILIAGIGVLICGFPHFLLKPYTNIPLGCNQTDPFVDYCSVDGQQMEDPCMVEYEQPGFSPVWWLIIGQILLGIGNVPVKPLGTTYIDDAVGKHTTPIYVAFLFIAVSIGPLLGFSLGSAATSLFVDFDRVAPEDRPVFTENDPRFVGAWWLGFICVGSAIILISIPFFFFPKKLPKSQERLNEDREAAKKLEADEENGIQMKALPSDKANGDTEKDVKRKEIEVKTKSPIHKTFFGAVWVMVQCYKRMFMNVGLLLLCISSAMEGANAAALGAFALKYYNVEFAVAPSLSALLAILVFPFNLVGSLVGGLIIKRRKWSPAKCVLFLLFGDVVAILGVPAFLFMGCQTQAIAGVSVPYAPSDSFSMMPTLQPDITRPDSAQQARSFCNNNCSCGEEAYNPVCGADGITYVSPCYAGCEVVLPSKDELNRTINSFSECNCIDPMVGGSSNATDGECAPECQAWQIPVLIIISIILAFCGGLGYSGLVLITLRIVEEDMRSAALGFQSVFLNLLGFFPAPVYFGALINVACILWSYDGSERGACWVYDRDTIRYAFHGMQGLIKVVSSIFFVGVYFVLRTPKGEKSKYQPELDEKTEQNT